VTAPAAAAPPARHGPPEGRRAGVRPLACQRKSGGPGNRANAKPKEAAIHAAVRRIGRLSSEVAAVPKGRGRGSGELG